MKGEMYESDLSLQCHSVYPLGIFMALMGTVIIFATVMKSDFCL